MRGPRRHFTHSKVMAWVAFDRAVKTVEQLRPRRAGRPLAARCATRSTTRCCDEGFNAERGAFTQYYGSDRARRELLLIPLVGFLPATDPRVVGTVDAIERELVRGGFVERYRADEENADVDGLPPGEGAFLPCSFWLADNLALQGRHDEARELFERLLGAAQRPRPALRGVRPRARPPGRQLPAGVHAHRHRRDRVHAVRARPVAESDPLDTARMCVPPSSAPGSRQASISTSRKRSSQASFATERKLAAEAATVRRGCRSNSASRLLHWYRRQR